MSGEVTRILSALEQDHLRAAELLLPVVDEDGEGISQQNSVLRAGSGPAARLFF